MTWWSSSGSSRRFPTRRTGSGGGRSTPTFYWPHLRLVVEVDSVEWHNDPLARHDDAERQAQLEAAGERVLRFTGADLRNPRRIRARLQAAGVKEA